MTRPEPYAEYRDVGARWLATVPAAWDVARLRNVCDVGTGSGDTINAEPNGEFDFFVRSQRPLRASSYDFNCEAILTAGDGGVGEVFHHVNGRFLAHQRVYVLRNFRRINTRFFFHYFSALFRQMCQDGSARTTVDSVRRWMLTDMPVALPPLDEQHAIADYLDRETTQIDALIGKQERLIETLRERRVSVIARTVATGGDSRQSVSAFAVRGGFHDGDWVESKDQDPSGDIRLLQLADVGDGVFKNRSGRRINDDAFVRLRCSYVLPGDILIARMPDPIGRACIVPDGLGRTITVVDVAVLRVDETRADKRYVVYALNEDALRREMESMQDGATRQRIPRKRLGRLTVRNPPLDEQRRIADYLDEQTATIDALIAKAERFIEVSKERRSALITAAVTGQIDVRDRVGSDKAQSSMTTAEQEAQSA